MRYPIIAGFILLPVLLSSAQRLQVLTYRKVPGDSTKEVKPYNQYFGIQANQLINQIFSFGNPPAVNNPYLLTYSVNSLATGSGFNAGVGYTVHSTHDQSDPNTERSTDVSTFSIRVGLEKKAYLSKRWLVSYGADLLYGDESNNSTTSTKFQFNTNSSESKSSTNYLGLGPRLTLNYFFSDRLLLGTEATYYFKSLKIDQKLTITQTFVTVDPNTGQQFTQTNTQTSDTSQKSKDFVFTAPVAIFLIFKF